MLSCVVCTLERLLIEWLCSVHSDWFAFYINIANYIQPNRSEEYSVQILQKMDTNQTQTPAHSVLMCIWSSRVTDSHKWLPVISDYIEFFESQFEYFFLEMKLSGKRHVKAKMKSNLRMLKKGRISLIISQLACLSVVRDTCKSDLWGTSTFVSRMKEEAMCFWALVNTLQWEDSQIMSILGNTHKELKWFLTKLFQVTSDSFSSLFMACLLIHVK